MRNIIEFIKERFVYGGPSAKVRQESFEEYQKRGSEKYIEMALEKVKDLKNELSIVEKTYSRQIKEFGKEFSMDNLSTLLHYLKNKQSPDAQMSALVELFPSIYFIEDVISGKEKTNNLKGKLDSYMIDNIVNHINRLEKHCLIGKSDRILMGWFFRYFDKMAHTVKEMGWTKDKINSLNRAIENEKNKI